MAKNEYLQYGRLTDVLFLIQHLGLGGKYSLRNGTEPDGIAPCSCPGGSWTDVARDHPEFFRVTEDSSVTLSKRYHLREGKGVPASLSQESVRQLMETAIALHERQVRHSEIWLQWGTFIAALASALFGFAKLF